MFNTSSLPPPTRPLSKEEVASQVSQELVFEHFGLSLDTLGERFCSPFRPDSHPDCKVYYNKQGKLLFYDPAAGLLLDAFDLACYLKNFTFPESLAWVLETFSGRQLPEPERLAALALYKQAAQQKTVLQIASQPHRKVDRDWWQQFNIGPEQLLLGRVFRVTDYWLNGKHFSAGADKCYAYGEYDGYKLYRPEAEKKYKWLSTTSALAGYDLLPQSGSLLVITSSKKDVLTLHSFGIPAVAPQGEGMDIDTHTLWLLKQRFARVVILYDNDAPGLHHARDKAAKWQVNGYVTTPANSGSKDPSDYCKRYGPAATQHLLNALLA